MPFTIKAEYRGTTRRFVFYQLPTWQELYDQLYKVFRIDGAYSLSRLLLSHNEDASSGRILIGIEIASAEAYDTAVLPFLPTHNNGGMLRFTVTDVPRRKEPNTSSANSNNTATAAEGGVSEDMAIAEDIAAAPESLPASPMHTDTDNELPALGYSVGTNHVLGGLGRASTFHGRSSSHRHSHHHLHREATMGAHSHSHRHRHESNENSARRRSFHAGASSSEERISSFLQNNNSSTPPTPPLPPPPPPARPERPVSMFPIPSSWGGGVGMMERPLPPPPPPPPSLPPMPPLPPMAPLRTLPTGPTPRSRPIITPAMLDVPPFPDRKSVV